MGGSGRLTVVGNAEGYTLTNCFDIFTMNLNGTTPQKFLVTWVRNRANLSLVVGLYDSCYSCEKLLEKFSTPDFKSFTNSAVHMLKIFYFVYKPAGTVLPVMPHCDNDFETMALKHSIAFDKLATKTPTNGRRLADFDHKCGCPYLPGFVDVADASWMETRKASGSFLRTLYRFTQVIAGASEQLWKVSTTGSSNFQVAKDNVFSG